MRSYRRAESLPTTATMRQTGRKGEKHGRTWQNSTLYARTSEPLWCLLSCSKTCQARTIVEYSSEHTKLCQQPATRYDWFVSHSSTRAVGAVLTFLPGFATRPCVTGTFEQPSFEELFLKCRYIFALLVMHDVYTLLDRHNSCSMSEADSRGSIGCSGCSKWRPHFLLL